ncbi:MAG TPA: hypothetical protein VG603_01760 [Chitinophagales bacterium]|nr:hypothetical protein [Chitinophagales bacterium]
MKETVYFLSQLHSVNNFTLTSDEVISKRNKWVLEHKNEVEEIDSEDVDFFIAPASNNYGHIFAKLRLTYYKK